MSSQRLHINTMQVLLKLIRDSMPHKCSIKQPKRLKTNSCYMHIAQIVIAFYEAFTKWQFNMSDIECLTAACYLLSATQSQTDFASFLGANSSDLTIAQSLTS